MGYECIIVVSMLQVLLESTVVCSYIDSEAKVHCVSLCTYPISECSF